MAQQLQPPPIKEIELKTLDVQGQLVAADCFVVAPAKPSFLRRHGLLLFALVLPLLLSGLYLGVIAADRYVSEAQFVVRSSAELGMETAAALLQTQGQTRATDKNFAVSAYIASRDALELLAENENLRAVIARPEGDFINVFPNFHSHTNKEALFRYYKQMVTATIDSASGITTVEVEAFRPEDAKAINEALLRYAEAFVNRLNARAREDALAYSNQQVAEATAELAQVENLFTRYRNEVGMVDAAKETASTMKSISRLMLEVTKLQVVHEQTAAVTPQSPSLKAVQEQINSLRGEINRLRGRLAGGDNSIASRLGEFEKLTLQRTIAAKRLEQAEISRQKARQEAEQQHLYLQTIVRPNLSDHAKYPRRMLYFLATALLSFFLYTTLRSVFSIASEHVTRR